MVTLRMTFREWDRRKWFSDRSRAIAMHSFISEERTYRCFTVYSGQRFGANCGARGSSGRQPWDRQDLGGCREGVVEGVLLPGREQCCVRGNFAEAKHGYPRSRVPQEGDP